ncbi:MULTISPECIES: MFS transporter [Arthrobacter]|uniref:MFS transporter n=2 Tax=Arthrobacter TaxID=1663 RepID=A0ABU9KJC4_9MICC|nr:MFS transporter [Arthrobacter sp. YJM1]MDP5226757.1 MFS transporter [Arthrobacter sp. YJM1]
MRAKLLILASAIGSLGWGAVLPYQYAYAADTRGWGALTAAGASSLFSLGALVASPLAGRLADRFNPVAVTVVAQLFGAVAVGSLMFVQSPVPFLLGMLAFGLGLSASVPAKQVLALQWSSSGDRRKVFAYKFTGESLGMAAGAFLAGLVVDLGRPDGLAAGFLMAGAGFVISSALIAVAGWLPAQVAAGAELESPDFPDEAPGSGRGALRTIFATPAMRWTAVLTIALALGFYAQFESGLPAYALTVLHAEPSVIGTAAAVNCLVIVALQLVVVRLTAKRSAPVLLMAVGGVWVLSWLILSTAQFLPGVAPALFVLTYGVFAVGETVYSPVLSPLTASLAPAGMVGQTLGVVGALQTAFSAAGPLIAGLLLGSGLGDVFLGMHLAFSVLAIVAAWRIRGLLRGKSTVMDDAAGPAAVAPSTGRDAVTA